MAKECSSNPSREYEEKSWRKLASEIEENNRIGTTGVSFVYATKNTWNFTRPYTYKVNIKFRPQLEQKWYFPSL